MHYYKIIDKNGAVVGLGAGETPMTDTEMHDELFGYSYVEISESEYIDFNEKENDYYG